MFVYLGRRCGGCVSSSVVLSILRHHQFEFSATPSGWNMNPPAPLKGQYTQITHIYVWVVLLLVAVFRYLFCRFMAPLQYNGGEWKAVCCAHSIKKKKDVNEFNIISFQRRCSALIINTLLTVITWWSNRTVQEMWIIATRIMHLPMWKFTIRLISIKFPSKG